MSIAVEELNGTNCKTYLLWSGKDAALVDPVRERAERYRREMIDRDLRLQWVIETHTHADHLMIGRKLKDLLGAPVVMHESSPIPLVDRHVRDGDRVPLGSDAIEIMHTPGHTPDSICLRISGAVLTGDTLFVGGSGRTDFPGGDAGAQYDAVIGRLFELPDDTVVWPAHDYRGHTHSTIGAEKRGNPRFVGRTRDEYITLMGNLGLTFPDKIQEALQVNQSGFEAGEVTFPRVHELVSVPAIAPDQVVRLLAKEDSPVILDVREPEEFVGDLGHVPGAVLVPLDALEGRLPKLAGYVDRHIVVVCRAGARSATAAAILRRAGFGHVENMAGGMVAWAAASLPVQR